MKLKPLLPLLAGILLIAALVFAVYGYRGAHRKYAGQLVWKTCAGDYITAESLGTGVNAGGPCLAVSRAFILKNNYALYYASLAIVGAVIVVDSVIVLGSGGKRSNSKGKQRKR